MSNTVKNILILGGGFAGIHTLLNIEKQFAHDDSVNITLISRENFFLFTPMLAEVAIGAVDPRHIVMPIRELCKKTIFHRGEVSSINLETQTVEVCYHTHTGEMETLAYDHLILALGSTSNVKMVPGVDKYALGFKELGDAMFIRNHILEMFERADTEQDVALRQSYLTFCIIGGGYSGVEVAAGIQELAHRIRKLYPTIPESDIRVVLVEALDRILPTLPEELAQYAHDQMSEMGIEVKTATRLTQVYPDSIEIHTGETIQTQTTIWATGIVISPLVMSLPVKKDQRGRPLGSKFLHLEEYQNVWGVGDNVLTPMPGEADPVKYYPATAQIAVRQGAHLAKNIHRKILGEPLQPFEYKIKGEMVVLGERSAVALIAGRKVKGRLAWIMWRFYYLSQLPGFKKMMRVAMDWILNVVGPMETTQLKIYNRQAVMPNKLSSSQAEAVVLK